MGRRSRWRWPAATVAEGAVVARDIATLPEARRIFDESSAWAPNRGVAICSINDAGNNPPTSRMALNCRVAERRRGMGSRVDQQAAPAAEWL